MMGTTVYVNKQLHIDGMRLRVEEMSVVKKDNKASTNSSNSTGNSSSNSAINNEIVQVKSGLITCNTKFTFRSRSARLFFLIQLSEEMWDFADDGELYFEKVIGFLKILFSEWQKVKVEHSISIIFFSRTYLDEEISTHQAPAAAAVEGGGVKEEGKRSKGRVNPEVQVDRSGRYYIDHYKVVVDSESHNFREWAHLLLLLKRNFNEYHELLNWGVADVHGEGYRGFPSTAVDGNILEAINCTISVYDKHYIDRDLFRTGQNIVMLSAGVGLYLVETQLAQLTKQRMVDGGIGCDLICMTRPPLHAVPLFCFRRDFLLDPHHFLHHTQAQQHLQHVYAYQQHQQNGGSSKYSSAREAAIHHLHQTPHSSSALRSSFSHHHQLSSERNNSGTTTPTPGKSHPHTNSNNNNGNTSAITVDGTESAAATAGALSSPLHTPLHHPLPLTPSHSKSVPYLSSSSAHNTINRTTNSRSPSAVRYPDEPNSAGGSERGGGGIGGGSSNQTNNTTMTLNSEDKFKLYDLQRSLSAYLPSASTSSSSGSSTSSSSSTSTSRQPHPDYYVPHWISIFFYDYQDLYVQPFGALREGHRIPDIISEDLADERFLSLSTCKMFDFFDMNLAPTAGLTGTETANSFIPYPAGGVIAQMQRETPRSEEQFAEYDATVFSEQIWTGIPVPQTILHGPEMHSSSQTISKSSLSSSRSFTGLHNLEWRASGVRSPSSVSPGCLSPRTPSHNPPHSNKPIVRFDTNDQFIHSHSSVNGRSSPPQSVAASPGLNGKRGEKEKNEEPEDLPLSSHLSSSLPHSSSTLSLNSDSPLPVDPPFPHPKRKTKDSKMITAVRTLTGSFSSSPSLISKTFQRRWGHLYATIDFYNTSLRPNWKSLCKPAVLPLTTDYFPAMTELRTNYYEYHYTLTLVRDENDYNNNPSLLLEEMICQRQAQDYQNIVTDSMHESNPGKVYHEEKEHTGTNTVTNASSGGGGSGSGGKAAEASQGKVISSKTLAPSKSRRQDKASLSSGPSSPSSIATVSTSSPVPASKLKKNVQVIYFSLRNQVHAISYDSTSGSINVKRYVHKRVIQDLSKLVKTCYRYQLWSTHSKSFHSVERDIEPNKDELDWNYADNLLCGHQDEMQEQLKYRRIRYAIIPTPIRKLKASNPSSSYSNSRDKSNPDSSSSSSPSLTDLRLADRTAKIANLTKFLQSTVSASLNDLGIEIAPLRSKEEDIEQQERGKKVKRERRREKTDHKFSHEEDEEDGEEEEEEEQDDDEAEDGMTETMVEELHPEDELKLKKEIGFALRDVPTRPIKVPLTSKLSSAKGESDELTNSGGSSGTSKVGGNTTPASTSINSSNSSESKRFEWFILEYDTIYDPRYCYHMEVKWLVATGMHVETWLKNMIRKGERFGFEIVKIPTAQPLRTCDSFHVNVHIPLPRSVPIMRLVTHYLVHQLNFVYDSLVFDSYDIFMHETGIALIRTAPDGLIWIANNLTGSPTYQQDSMELFDKISEYCRRIREMRELVWSLVQDAIHVHEEIKSITGIGNQK